MTYIKHTVLVPATERGMLISWLTTTDWLIGRRLELGRVTFTMAEHGQLFVSTVPMEPDGGSPRKKRPDPDAEKI